MCSRPATAPPDRASPNAAESYRRHIKSLKAALASADRDNRADAINGIRQLIEKVVVRAGDAFRPVHLEIRGIFTAIENASATV